jgi:hypothetical protein
MKPTLELLLQLYLQSAEQKACNRVKLEFLRLKMVLGMCFHCN